MKQERMKESLKRNIAELNPESGDEFDEDGFPMLDHYDNSTPRTGKWSVEEEKYCKQLIDAFENGKLPDCIEGTSLRAYLSKKLNCSPMRISKKFAGLGIGKVSKYLCINTDSANGYIFGQHVYTRFSKHCRLSESSDFSCISCDPDQDLNGSTTPYPSIFPTTTSSSMQTYFSAYPDLSNHDSMFDLLQLSSLSTFTVREMAIPLSPTASTAKASVCDETDSLSEMMEEESSLMDWKEEDAAWEARIWKEVLNYYCQENTEPVLPLL
jgi:hypothetical protein